jgi:UDP-glucose 4-epimerase
LGCLLVTGGAGYVGSHAVRELARRGDKVIVLDDLSEGHREAIPGMELLEDDLNDHSSVHETLDAIFGREPFDVVLHFAGRAYVGESVRDPERYYRTNVGGGVELLAAMARNNVPAIIFSSTCATYGEPETIPISEEHPQHPFTAYGRTKLAFEHALKDFEIALETWARTTDPRPISFPWFVKPPWDCVRRSRSLERTTRLRTERVSETISTSWIWRLHTP